MSEKGSFIFCVGANGTPEVYEGDLHVRLAVFIRDLPPLPDVPSSRYVLM